MPATILVVDDSRTMRAMVKAALVAGDYQVVEAPGAREALRALDDTPVDLVITDVNMPEIDGLTLVRRLRARPRERTTPILVLTTEASEVLQAQGREAGATGWLVKPFQPAQLLQTVRQVLGAGV
jgi:two-component system chemotaxis response regulator CheY